MIAIAAGIISGIDIKIDPLINDLVPDSNRTNSDPIKATTIISQGTNFIRWSESSKIDDLIKLNFIKHLNFNFRFLANLS